MHKSGDTVHVCCGVYALRTDYVGNWARFTPAGSLATVVRRVDANAVIVRFAGGLQAPVHPSALRYESREVHGA